MRMLSFVHELEALKAKVEEESIVKSLKAMKKCPSYLAEMQEITEGLNTDLPDEEKWW